MSPAPALTFAWKTRPMQPTTVLVAATAELLAADAATLAPPALANHVHLIAAAFTPGVTTDFTALTAATFTGSAAKSAGVGAQTAGIDPATGRRKVIFLEPAGGWNWECTVAPGAPETIYGYAVTDNADTVTLGSKLLPTPVTVSAVGHLVSVDEVSLLLAAIPWT